MTRPIKVTRCHNGYSWRCTLGGHSVFGYLTGHGTAYTIAQAADAGRAHWRRHHGTVRQSDYVLAN